MYNCKNYTAHGGNDSGGRAKRALEACKKYGFLRAGTPGAIRNAHGANAVIGGKLTFLPGAQVEGLSDLLDSAESGAYTLPAATANTLGGVKAAVNQPESAATTIAAMKDDLNALLAKLKAAGIMLADAEPGA